MKKLISVLAVASILITLVVLEQVFIHNTFDNMIQKISALDTDISNTETIKNQDILEQIDDIDNYWIKRENILCLSMNQNELNKVGEQIKKVKVYIEQDNKNDCVYELDTLLFYVQSFKKIMEITPQNFL